MPKASIRSRRDGGHAAAEGTTPTPPGCNGALHGLSAASAPRIGSSATRPMVADQLRPTLPRLAAFMDDRKAALSDETDVLAYMAFPLAHTGPSTVGRAEPRSGRRPQAPEGCTRSTRASGPTARSSGAPTWSASSPTRPAITRLVGALLPEQADEGAVQRARYMTL
jgi:putative transposase